VRAALVLGIACLSAGCAATNSRADRPLSTARTGETTFAGSGVTFRYPSTWRDRSGAGPASSMDHPIVALSAGLPDPCRDPISGQLDCTSPLIPMPQGGVLVTVSMSGFGGVDTSQWPGERLSIDGMPAWLAAGRPTNEECPPSADWALSAQLLTRDLNDNWYQVTVCARGPGIAHVAAEARALVRSFRAS
jgi:hypothetical protein